MKYQNIFVYSVIAIGLLSISSLLDSIYGQTNATQQNQTAAQLGQNQTAAQLGQNQTAAQQGSKPNSSTTRSKPNSSTTRPKPNSSTTRPNFESRSSSIKYIRYPRNKG